MSLVPNRELDDSLTPQEWARIRRTMLTTGQFDPNILHRLNDYQKYWVNETKLAIRDLSKS